MTIQTAQDMDMNQVLDAWSRRVPRSAIARPLSRTQVTDFFQTSHRLIQLRDAPTTHRVITELASEGGLARVAELVKLTELSLTYVYLSEYLFHARDPAQIVCLADSPASRYP